MPAAVARAVAQGPRHQEQVLAGREDRRPLGVGQRPVADVAGDDDRRDPLEVIHVVLDRPVGPRLGRVRVGGRAPVPTLLLRLARPAAPEGLTQQTAGAPRPRPVPQNDEAEGLAVRAGRRPARGVEDLREILVRDRLRAVAAHGARGGEQFEEVVGVHGPYNPPPAKSASSDRIGRIPSLSPK